MSVEQIAEIVIAASRAFDRAMRQLHPVVLADIRRGLLDHLEPLGRARQALLQNDSGNPDDAVRSGLLRAADLLANAIRNFADEDDLQTAYISALRAARKHCRALEALYPLCSVLPEVNRYFLEEGVKAASPPESRPAGEETGIIHVGANRDLRARGGYSLYIPEAYTPERAWPLVIALHGGYSHGRDFIWTWITEARSRGLIIFAPTSQAMTWSIADVGVDAQVLHRHLEDVSVRVRIDRSSILLTGMSDGGTFALALALSAHSSYSVLAPVSCALPPVDSRRAKDKRILWVHGARDWIFPAGGAVQSCRHLQQSGADIHLKVIEDLSHTYPREANDAILKWSGIERSEQPLTA